MATTTATITLSSTDLLSDELALTTTSTLTQAGNNTGVTQASGLTRKTVGGSGYYSPDSAAGITRDVLYRSDDYSGTNSANKVYIKNTSTTATQFFTVHVGQTKMGHLYAGDWCFFPWDATAGTKESFVVTVGGVVAVGDSWEFDGITTNSAGSSLTDFAAAINAQVYPNWTTSVNGAAVTFTARYAASDGVVTASDAITGDVINDLAGSNLTMNITSGTFGSSALSDITIQPSVHDAAMTYECMLIHG